MTVHKLIQMLQRCHPDENIRVNIENVNDFVDSNDSDKWLIELNIKRKETKNEK